jgi:hypothetical protein
LPICLPSFAPAVRAYVDATPAEYDARMAPGTAIARTGSKWWLVDPVVQKLEFG